nr:MAG TPA: hypothetical protein [Caudoviricetes sp.]
MKHVYNTTNIKVNDKIPLFGAKRVRIRTTSGSCTLRFDDNYYVSTTALNSQTPLYFPVIDGKSPLYATVVFVSADTVGLSLFIDEIGGVPDENYWKL